MEILIVALSLYFLPTIIALANNHHNAVAIFVLNLLLGWTLVGWVIALVWVLTKPAPPPVVIVQGGQGHPSAPQPHPNQNPRAG